MRRLIPPVTFIVGVLLIAACETLLYVDVSRRDDSVGPIDTLGYAARWVAVNMTALCWVGYLLTLDGLLAWTRSGSPIRLRPNRFVVAWLTSVPVWCYFDWVNFYFLDAWRYEGLPEGFSRRVVGYLIAFAAISPGMFLAAEAAQRLGVRRLRRPGLAWALTLGPAAVITVITLALLPAFGRGAMGETRGVIASGLLLAGPAIACLIRRQSLLVVSGAIGLGFSAWSVLAQQPLGCMTLWVGLIYLIDPINAKLGAPSILRDWQAGRLGRTASLMIGGLVCGLLWEFWNYWAIAKWTYHLPFLGGWESLRYFEMPVLGLLGFLPFAVECWVVLNLIIAVLERCRLRVAEALPDDQAVM